MRFGSLVKRLDDIQREECPGCKALHDMSDEELDRHIDALIANIRGEVRGEAVDFPEGFQHLPEHWRGCPEAGGDKEMSPEEIEALIKSCEDIMEPPPPEDPDKDICPWCKRHIHPGAGSYTGPAAAGGRRICQDCYTKRGSQAQYSTPTPGPDTANPGPDVLRF